MSMEASVQALAAAIELHQAGRLAEAEQIYQQILAVEPNHPDAWHLLGVVAHQTGNHQIAVNHIQYAIGLKGTEAAYYSNLGEAYRAMGMLPDAVACYRRALELAPALANAHNNLGLALQDLGEREDAIACYQRALQLRPDHAEAHNNLGRALQDQGRLDEAIACYQRALELKPGFAMACNNLGTALCDQGRATDAVAYYRLALECAPDFADAHSNLGSALREEGRTEEAILCCRRALELRPDFAEAWNNLGRALQDQGQIGEAMQCYQRALELNPSLAIVQVNLGTLFHEQNRVAEAIACYRRALELASSRTEVNTNADCALQDQEQPAATTRSTWARELRSGEGMAHFSLAMLWLATGDFEQGWREYEWRWQTKHARPRRFPQPLWDGRPLAGRTILLHAEQGLGDTIQFVRYVPIIKSLGATVILECQTELLSLLAGFPGVDWLVGHGADPPPFDVQAPLLSLPGILGTRLGNIPADVPYLSPLPQLVCRWRDRLGSVGGVKVGINWQGSPAYHRDRHRSIRLAHFAPLAKIPGVCLISLQKGPGTEQLPEVAELFPITDLGGSFDEASGPFVDTAAIMMSVDLVITSDTAVAHLAGALGVPVWVALPFCPDWRWLLEREDSPWYPTMRLFRQTEPGNWDGVFQRIAAALAEFVSTRQESRSGDILVETAPGELVDKITILRIKAQRITDPRKLRNVNAELAVLSERQRISIPGSERLAELTAELQRINETLWDTEDEIRRCEARQEFGARFVELARSVYRANDCRAAVKRAINDLVGSRFVEEKQYVEYENLPPNDADEIAPQLRSPATTAEDSRLMKTD